MVDFRECYKFVFVFYEFFFKFFNNEGRISFILWVVSMFIIVLVVLFVVWK